MGSAASFRLTRYFTITSLVAFVVVGVALYLLERAEQTFLQSVQQEQAVFFAQTQAEFMARQQSSARQNLLIEHEAGHTTLARLFANASWETHFAPLVERAARLPVDATLGARIQALPGFREAHAHVQALMRKSSVFKIKVYDLRGITVYSSELAQVGEDKSQNIGWASAVKGRPATELVHRDRFSAFEGVVENRDLVQSYVPVLAAEGDRVHGVFEIYSDVTALLAQVESLSAHFAAMAGSNQARLEEDARRNEERVASNSRVHFAVLGSILIVLYVALMALVLNAQRILDAQQRERERAALREQQWHREKMAALATMAANASHEIGNPLAVIAALADDLASGRPAGDPVGDPARTILEQSSRIAEMNRRITEFAAARGESPEPIDVNRMVRAVGEFFGFDERYRGEQLDMRLAAELPACTAVPDHLNEVLMSLLQAHAESHLAANPGGGRLFIETARSPGHVVICIGPSQLADADPRLESARLRLEKMGGTLEIEGPTSRIRLPALAP